MIAPTLSRVLSPKQEKMAENTTSGSGLGAPHVWRQLDLGPCLSLWNSRSYLQEKIGEVKASFHESDSTTFDYRHKAFVYVLRTFSEVFFQPESEAGIPLSQQCDSSHAANVDGRSTASIPAETTATSMEKLEENTGSNSKKNPNEPPTTSASSTPEKSSSLSSPSSNSCRRAKHYYYRATPSATRAAATLGNTVPALEGDFNLPDQVLNEAKAEACYSTVLRMCSPGAKVWLHYDVCDNVLCQVVGRKRVLLWPSECVDALGFDSQASSSVFACQLLRCGSRSDVERLVDEAMSSLAIKDEHEEQKNAGVRVRSSSSSSASFVNLDRGKVLESWERRVEVILEPGDAVLIPALWPHCTEDLRIEDLQDPQSCCIEGDQERRRNDDDAVSCFAGMSINVFFHTEDLSGLYKAKDAWANHDYPVFQRACNAIEKAVKTLADALPTRCRAFYLKKLALYCQELANKD
ncbi:unnamed protein product [Amoebophrya sp. A25]|nr:unnamed protein product [Amoebophrya sp. A25]|eukprot:GSA25T00024766001.1